MVTVKKGDVISAKDFISGKSKDGKTWCRGEIKADTGYDKLTLWIDNPDAQLSGNMAQVRSINAVTLSHRKYEKKDGTTGWSNDFNVNVSIEDYSGKAPENNYYENVSPVPGFTKMSEDDIPF